MHQKVGVATRPAHLKNGEGRKRAQRNLKKKQGAAEWPEKFEMGQQPVGAAMKTREGREGCSNEEQGCQF